MSIPKDIIQLHEDLIELGSLIRSKSESKFKEEEHIEKNVQAVFYKIIAYAITLHRAVLSLCEEKWTHVTPILLRTIIDCSANCLVIIHNEYPEYMAFKYFYYEYIRILRDNSYSESLRQKNQHDIEQGLRVIQNATAKEKAERSVQEGNVGIFWFKPEENNYSSIIRNYGSDELKFLWGGLSMAVHAAHLGLFLFKDDPDDIDINPCENPIKTKGALIMSCRLLLELLNIENEYENLGFNS
ncbi:MAG: hypothetical protein JRI72_16170, partial [Deltaproteobacteria bacterium]|nr:hypothetical protein [Deltaproteobacteria bacterium]